ncbi:unnamed protein product, partial [marine sediment metagenome]
MSRVDDRNTGDITMTIVYEQHSSGFQTCVRPADALSLNFKAGLPASHVASFEHLPAKLGLKRIGQLGFVVP